MIKEKSFEREILNIDSLQYGCFERIITTDTTKTDNYRSALTKSTKEYSIYSDIKWLSRE